MAGNNADFRIIRAAFGKSVDRVPVFLHRQAGRHLPEYIELKGDRDFFELCEDPELASEITLQPVRRYDVDAAIIFSDILTLPKALNFDIEMVPKQGPVFKNPLKLNSIYNLSFKVDLKQKLLHVYKAIELTASKLKKKVPLIGFTGGPWTLMVFMIEGKSVKTPNKAKKWIFAHEKETKYLLGNLTKLIIEHLENQISAGAKMVEIFETLAGELGKKEFEKFVLPHLREISRVLKSKMSSKKLPKTPIAVFAKGANYSLKEIAQSGCDVVAIDWHIDPKEARDIVNCTGITLMGNLDPSNLHSSIENIKKNTKEMVRSFGKKGYIANLGHGVLPDTKIANVTAFVNTVHSSFENTENNENK